MSVGDPCAHPGCSRLQTAKSGRKMCPVHYKRLLSGAPMDAPVRLPNGETSHAFEELLALPLTDDCILWPHGRTRQGYGKMTLPSGRPVNVHVRVLEVTAGPRPTRLHDAMHSCRNRHCMNPRHLRWGTKSENSLDRHRDGTCTQATLTPDDVREIRRLLRTRELLQREIADRYGVSVSTIEYIKARRIWAHVPEEDE